MTLGIAPWAAQIYLVLTHTRQPAGLARGTAAGWHAHVDLLDGYLQGVALEWDKVYPPVKALYASAVESIVD